MPVYGQPTCKEDAEDDDDGQDQKAHEDEDCIASNPFACSLRRSFRLIGLTFRAAKQGCSLIDLIDRSLGCGCFSHVVQSSCKSAEEPSQRNYKVSKDWPWDF